MAPFTGPSRVELPLFRVLLDSKLRKRKRRQRRQPPKCHNAVNQIDICNPAMIQTLASVWMILSKKTQAIRAVRRMRRDDCGTREPRLVVTASSCRFVWNPSATNRIPSQALLESLPLRLLFRGHPLVCPFTPRSTRQQRIVSRCIKQRLVVPFRWHSIIRFDLTTQP